MNSHAKVIKAHRSSYPNPITLRENEIVMISHCDLEWRGWIWIRQNSGNAGWAPQQIFTLSAPDQGICTEYYTAYELSVVPGEILMLEKKLNGWFWACRKSGEAGWVPEENVMIISE